MARRHAHRPRASWTDAIETAIDDAGVVVAILSPGSYASLVAALSNWALRKRKRVIPLLADANADRPLHLEHLDYRDLSSG